MKRTVICVVLILATVSLLFARGASESAETYPKRAIDLVCAGSAGSGGDTLARVIAIYLGEELGVTVNVINTAGGSGIPAVQSVLDAAPDGYTLMADQGYSSSFQYALNPGSIPYDIVKDRRYIAKISSGPQVLCGSANMGWTDIRDVARYLKEGNYKELTGGGISPSSAANFAFLQFCLAYGIDFSNFKEIRYTGGGDILAAIAGGHISIGSCAASGVFSYVQDNLVLPLVVCGPARLASLPNVPSAAELGLDTLTADFWIGISGRADLPEYVVTTIDNAAQRVIKNDRFLADIAKIGAVVNYVGPHDMQKAIVDEGAMVIELVKLGQ